MEVTAIGLVFPATAGFSASQNPQLCKRMISTLVGFSYEFLAMLILLPKLHHCALLFGRDKHILAPTL
jgi:hypothetical protein